MAKIPVEFYNLTRSGKRSHPRAKTVGQLIKQLERLPKGLKIGDQDTGVQVIVYNHGTDDMHVSIDEWF